MGRSYDRALLSRAPLEELWLRAGHRRDPDPFDFGLLRAAAVWDLPAGRFSAEGFALSRDRSRAQAEIDPGYGGRTAAEGRFRVFGGDLEVWLRLGADLVGRRESEAEPPRRLGAYVTSHAEAILTLSDFTLSISMRGLEDRPQPQSWISSLTGREALGPGRATNVRLFWRLFD